MEKSEETISGKKLKGKLRIKADRTIEVYVRDGNLPQPIKELESEDLYFSKAEVLEMLGAKSLEENFIGAEEVSEILELSIEKVHALAYKDLIPNYRLKNVRGSQVLFLRSEVEAAKQFTITWSASAGNRLIREQATKEILSQLADEKMGFLTGKASEVFTDIMINGKTLQEIADKFSLTTARVRMIFDHSLKVLTTKLAYINLVLEADQQKNTELAELRKTVEYYKEKEKRYSAFTPSQAQLLATELRQFDLSPRILNIFRDAEVITVADLVKHTEQDLHRYRNWGKKSTTEVIEFLSSKGLSLGMKI